MMTLLKKDGATIITIENPSGSELRIIEQVEKVLNMQKKGWGAKKNTGWGSKNTEKKGWGAKKNTGNTFTNTNTAFNKVDEEDYVLVEDEDLPF